MGSVKIKVIDNSSIFFGYSNVAIARALEAIGLTAEGYAKLRCPVHTGRLRSSITHAVDDKTAFIGTNVEYAAYVEMGTVKTKAQPYLRPAVAGHADVYKRIALNALKLG